LPFSPARVLKAARAESGVGSVGRDFRPSARNVPTRTDTVKPRGELGSVSQRVRTLLHVSTGNRFTARAFPLARGRPARASGRASPWAAVPDVRGRPA